MTLRALHLLRDDHAEHVGGDLSLLTDMVSGLRSAGVDAVAADWHSAPDELDIVHLYNLWRPDHLVRDARRARERWPDARLAVTTIFWPFPLRDALLSRDWGVVRRALRTNLKSRVTSPKVRGVLLDADLVVVQSRVEVALVDRWFRGGGRFRTATVPNGIRVADWAVERTADRTPALRALGVTEPVEAVVACVAAIAPRKNQRNLVKAVAGLPGVALLLVGPLSDHPPYGEAVLAEARRDLAGRFAWTGAVGRDDVRRLLGLSDVHVLASYLEAGSSVACLEAAAAGCEVVMAHSDSSAELWGGAAHECRPNDVASIAAAVSAARTRPKQPATGDHVATFDVAVLGAMIASAYEVSDRHAG
ncbi:MAG: glycosyltransferase [Acidimicrobiales bacterium]